MAEAACIISNGIQVRGNLSGSGDLIVQGRMEGQVSLQAHITVEESGTVVADIETQELTVHGKINGNTDANDRISISSSATYVGDLRAPRIVLEDGARFRGTIEMDVPLPDGV
ncbi:MAG: polymer-forming cytoskeletal protein [Deltaproteobacteria bacterium]|nr:polymer-forming cytoskeletal protein [Deltaproteobacteria bacterium]